MTTATIDDMRRDLSGYLGRVRAGETVVIIQNDEPVAELRPIESRLLQPRPFGLCKGEFRVPDDFDAPLPDAIMREFEGV